MGIRLTDHSSRLEPASPDGFSHVAPFNSPVTATPLSAHENVRRPRSRAVLPSPLPTGPHPVVPRTIADVLTSNHVGAARLVQSGGEVDGFAIRQGTIVENREPVGDGRDGG